MRSTTADRSRTAHVDRRVDRGHVAIPPPAESPPTTPRLSVIIPARNEEDTLGLTLERIRQSNVWEVVVVDGQSTDRTCEIAARYGATVLSCEPGRGLQMNIGARAATGDVLLFLHADTSLRANYDQHILGVLSEPDVVLGGFRLMVDAPGRLFRLLERAANFRAGHWHMPYGDQGLFMKADVFRRLGGFPEFPAMEDYAFVRKARREGRVRLADASVLTSGRRWMKRGLVWTTLQNRICVIAYHLGVSPERIARWRSM